MKPLRYASLFLFFFFCLKAHADVLYLKNGRSISGIIQKEDNELVELEISGGAVRFQKSEIERIEKSAPGNADSLRRQWEKQKIENQDRIEKIKKEEARKPKRIEFAGDSQSIVLNVTLNKKVEAELVLDTGASIVILRRGVAEKLGINLGGAKPDMQMQVADGRRINAKHIILESVKTQGAEAENVDAAVLLEETGGIQFGDGLLGMSFLKKFNFKVDHKEKKLILEKL